jgi:hypothetical protein
MDCAVKVPEVAAGNWVPELVELAGGFDVLGAAGEHSPWAKQLVWAGGLIGGLIALGSGFSPLRLFSLSARSQRLAERHASLRSDDMRLAMELQTQLGDGVSDELRKTNHIFFE